MNWGQCNASCGIGKQQRIRGCTGNSNTLKCEGKQVDERDCPHNVECVPEWNWAPWEDCTCTSIYTTRHRLCKLKDTTIDESRCQNANALVDHVRKRCEKPNRPDHCKVSVNKTFFAFLFFIELLAFDF